MKNVLFAMSLLVAHNAFSQINVVDTLHHEGEVFEVVIVTPEDLGISSQVNYFDLLKAGERLALRPIPRMATANLWMRMVSGENNIPKDGLHRVYYVSQPMTSLVGLEEMLYIWDSNRHHIPIGKIDGTYRMPLSWFGKSSWLFLRAIHSPKP